MEKVIGMNIKQQSGLRGFMQKNPTSQVDRKDELGKDQFLQLLVTQLKYQDPLDPMKNDEFIAQTAQFSAMEQMQQVKENIAKQSVLYQQVVNASTVQYIGKSVLTPGNKIELTAGKSVQFGADVPSAANLTVNIKNRFGRIVDTLHLNTNKADRLDIEWDGHDADNRPLPDGTYKFEIQGVNSLGEMVLPVALTKGKVAGISNKDGKTMLSVDGRLVDPSKVLATTN